MGLVVLVENKAAKGLDRNGSPRAPGGVYLKYSHLPESATFLPDTWWDEVQLLPPIIDRGNCHE